MACNRERDEYVLRREMMLIHIYNLLFQLGYVARSEILTAGLLKIQIFRVVTLYRRTQNYLNVGNF